MIQRLRRRIARPFRDAARKAMARGAWAEALANFKRVEAINPGNRSVLLPIANMHAELGEHAQAEKVYYEAAQIPEYRVEARIGMARIAVRKAEWPEARSRWESVLEAMAEDEAKSPVVRSTWSMSPAEIFLQSSLARELVGDAAGAERDLVLAMALEPPIRRSAAASLMRGRMLVKDDVRAGYRVLLSAHRRYSQDFSILYELTSAAVVAGERGEADRLARALIALQPDNASAQALLRERGLVVGG
ncbi:tetratricopeptide repeat protein [Brevundimonas sp.]|jgi:tetratricopeptide (TPR) repeat protein|uniref:tetratricopeptide repeat protein n=1 Tax=Brevundimonas sp. TaxID=1871086 RepID=UPI00378421DD